MADRPNNRKNMGGKAKARKRNSFAIFYVITLIIGVAVCVVLFALAYQTLVPDRIIGDRDPNPPVNDPTEFVRVEPVHLTGMVTASNTFAQRSITVLGLESSRTENFNLTDTTSIQDRRGRPIGFAEITPGRIVDLTFDADTRDLSAISISVDAWEQQPSNFIINLDDATVTVGNRVYTYSSRTLVLNRGEPHSIHLINSEDVITMIGYDDKIWSIRVDSGHGFIRFANADRVVGGTVTVGNSIHTTLDGDRPLAVVEGTHRIIVNGQNIDPFIADVVVRMGQTVEVNLAEMAMRHGALQLLLNEPEASIFINGEAAELENTLIELEFGEHLLRVEMPGFIPIQQEIEITQAFTRLELNLVPDVSSAEILIETFPSDAQLFLNGAFIGNSPLVHEIEFGSSTIIARRAGHEDSSLHIVVGENSPRQYLLPLIQLPMHPPTGQLPPTVPGGPGQLPPMSPEVTPIPSPTLQPDWTPPGTGQGTGQNDLQPPPPPESLWPPSPEDLPVPTD